MLCFVAVGNDKWQKKGGCGDDENFLILKAIGILF
jgi:hypothetical protein